MTGSKNVSIWYLKLVNGEFHEVGWGWKGGNVALLLGATVTVAAMVVTINRLFWRRMGATGIHPLQARNVRSVTSARNKF
ncbi:MAG: hypothetical protein ABSB88_24700 [Bryobacteraceae bacterium]|jgi:hypothetical protein